MANQAQGTYVVWLVDGAALYPTALTHGVSVLLGSGAPVVMMNGHYARLSNDHEPVVNESFYFPERVFQDAACLISPLLSLSMFMYDPSADGVPRGFTDIDTADWVFFRDVETAPQPHAQSASMSFHSLPDENETPSLTELQCAQTYQLFGAYSAFDPATRDAQNERIAPLGIAQASQGRTTLVLVVDRNLSAIQSCIRELQKWTLVPHDYVIVYSEDDEDSHLWVTQQRDVRDDIRGAKAPCGAPASKGLTRA